VSNRFAGWLQASMHSRGLTQAQLARSVGVADTQVSRWRRGQVVPTVQSLQRLADTFGVPRVTLDHLVGLPVAQAPGAEPELEAELQAHQARLRKVMHERLPREMWKAYVEACVALAEGLKAQTERAARTASKTPNDEPPPERHLGFRP
jgi:transcriptional regulator with XRE-family HTH domain